MDIQQIMQQAQAMQSKMQELQDELGDTETEGRAGGGMVVIRATCRGEIRNIHIDDSLMKVEEKEMLEDLLKAAMNDAKSNSDNLLAEKTAEMMRELGLPAGAQLPF